MTIHHLVSGDTQSCGCLAHEHRVRNGRSPARIAASAEAHRSHGLRSHTLYSTWKSMLHRCLNENDPKFHHYGGRGVTVCAEWRDVRDFIAWIEANLGPRPEGMTLDRIDNDGNYEPGNVRWATASEQSLNQRRRAQVAQVRSAANGNGADG